MIWDYVCSLDFAIVTDERVDSLSLKSWRSLGYIPPRLLMGMICSWEINFHIRRASSDKSDQILVWKLKASSDNKETKFCPSFDVGFAAYLHCDETHYSNFLW